MTKEFSKEFRLSVKKTLNNQPSIMKDFNLVEKTIGIMTIAHDIVDGLDLDPDLYSNNAIIEFDSMKKYASIIVNLANLTEFDYDITETLALKYLDIIHNHDVTIILKVDSIKK